jgi:hypothetical protein
VLAHWDLERAGVARRLDEIESVENLRRTCTAAKQRAKRLVAKDEAESRENSQMHWDGRTHHEEECVHRLSVDGSEFDGMLEKAERHERPRDMQHDGISHVRYCDAVADASGAERFPCLEHIEQELAILLGREGQTFDELRENLALRRTADVLEDSAFALELSERRYFIGRAVRLLEQRP